MKENVAESRVSSGVFQEMRCTEELPYDSWVDMVELPQLQYIKENSGFFRLMLGCS